MRIATIQPVQAYDALREVVNKIHFVNLTLKIAVENDEVPTISTLLNECAMTITEARKALSCFSHEAVEMMLRGDVYTYPEEETES
jgi:hypothetical protein